MRALVGTLMTPKPQVYNGKPYLKGGVLATKTAAPMTEKGYTNAFAGFGNGFGMFFDVFEDNPELLWPNSVRTFTKMGREDARTASVLRAVGLPVRRTCWRIDPNGARDEVVAFVATDMGLPIVGQDETAPKPRMTGRFSWSRHLKQALLSQKFGHSIFERTYTIGPDGRAHLGRVSARPASTISYWNVARDGELVSVQQWPAGTFTGAGVILVGPTTGPSSPMGGAEITSDRLVVYLNEPEDGIPYGNSLLRPAFKHWQLKDKFMRIEAVAAERGGGGVPGFTASPEESQDPERIELYREMASAYRFGQNAGFAIPAGATFKLYGVEGNTNIADIRQAIEYHDRQMGVVALAHFLNLEGSGGSYALASVQADTFVQSVQTVANDIRDTAQVGLVEDLVTANWGADEPVPMLVFDEIGSQQDPLASSLALLAQAGLIRPDPALEAAIRENMNLPSPDPDEAYTALDQPAQPAVTPSTGTAAARARQRREHPKNLQATLFDA